MKTVPRLAILLFLLATAQAEDKPSYTLSLERARAFNTAEGEEIMSEMGDSQGPFQRIGGMTSTAPGCEDISVSYGEKVVSNGGGVKDPAFLIHTEFFVNEQGHGFTVVHKRPVPDAEPLPEDARPSEHIQLCKAAERAIASGNTELLKALLQAGLLVNTSLDLSTGWAPLHYAIVHNQVRVAKMLLANGASPTVEDKYGNRPIDDAFADGMMEFCKLMAQPNRKDRKIGEYPEEMLNELFFREAPPRNCLMFLTINDQDPDKEMLEYFQSRWKKVLPRSASEVVESKYQDPKTHEVGEIVEIHLKAKAKGTYEWARRIASGPVMAGGGTTGKVTLKYGYWIKHDKSGWVE